MAVVARCRSLSQLGKKFDVPVLAHCNCNCQLFPWPAWVARSPSAQYVITLVKFPATLLSAHCPPHDRRMRLEATSAIWRRTSTSPTSDLARFRWPIIVPKYRVQSRG